MLNGQNSVDMFCSTLLLYESVLLSLKEHTKWHHCDFNVLLHHLCHSAMFKYMLSQD